MRATFGGRVTDQVVDAPEPEDGPPQMQEPPAPADRGPTPTAPGGTPAEQPLPPHVEEAYQRLSRRAVFTTIVIVVLVLGAAVFIGSKAIARRFEGARQLDRALTLLEGADDVVLDVDEVVRAQLSTETARQARELGSKLPSAKTDLEEARRLIDDSLPKVTEDEQERAKLTRASVVARLSMLDPAETILDATAKAGVALAPAKDGWALVLAAESLADESTREYNKLQKASVIRSTALADQATKKLQAARREFEAAESSLPGAGFDDYVDYVNGKLAMLNLTRQSNNAWLAGKIADANNVAKRYNTKEQAVIAIAKKLPATPTGAIADAYGALADEATAVYNRARKQASQADSRLNAF